MFTTHFKMSQQPFQEYPPIEGFFSHEAFSQGAARLTYFASGPSDVALLSADSGLGKSSLIRYFLHHLTAQAFNPVSIPFSGLSRHAFLRSMVSSLGETPAMHKDVLFQQVVKKTASANGPTLFLIDNAHLLCDETLVDLKLLLSANQERVHIKLIFIANHELKKRFKETQHTSLAQRMSLLCSLSSFDEVLTHQYLDFQMRFAGSNDKVFEDNVKSELQQYTHGCPRLINNLATHCLIGAAIKKVNIIDRTVFQQALNECPLFV